MYKPTIEELIKLWFKPHVSSEHYMSKNIWSSWMILYDSNLNIFSTTPMYLYPKSAEDIEKFLDMTNYML